MKETKRSRILEMEFSKKLLLIQCAASFLLVLAVVVVALRGGDISILAALAGGTVLMDGTVSGFYLWKSKNENRAKYAERFALEFAEKYGFDSAVRITEIVLRD